MSGNTPTDKPIFDICRELPADPFDCLEQDELDFGGAACLRLTEDDSRPFWKRTVNFLSIEEERALVVRMRSGDGGSREKLIASHWPLCAKIASRYRGNLDLERATASALSGLIAAVDNPEFDPKQHRLGTFAWKRMMGEVLEERHRASGIVDYPRPSNPATQTARDKAERYRSNPSFWAPPAWASNQRGCKPQFARHLIERPLDQTFKSVEGGELSRHDVVASEAPNPEQSLASYDRLRLTSRLRSELSERERRVYDARFDTDEKIAFAELGKEFGLSGESARQIEIGIRAKLTAIDNTASSLGIKRRQRSGPVPGGYVTQSGYFRSHQIEMRYLARAKPRSLEPEWFARSYTLPEDMFLLPRRSEVRASPSQAVFRGIEGRIVQVLFRSRSNRSYRERCQDIFSELITSHGDMPLRALQRLRWAILKWCRSGRSGVIVRSLNFDSASSDDSVIWAPGYMDGSGGPRLSERELRDRHHNTVSWWGVCPDHRPHTVAA